MKKIISVVLVLTLLLSSCAKPPVEDPKYESVARLYTEMLWRKIDDSDKGTLDLCSESVQKQIKDMEQQAQELLRKRKYLTKDEVHELVGDLTEYYSRKKDEFIALQEMAVFYDEEPKTIDDYEPVQILTKDTYETKFNGDSAYIELETGEVFYFDVPKQYSGLYDIVQSGFDGEIYKYDIELEDETKFSIYVDVKNGKVERLKEVL